MEPGSVITTVLAEEEELKPRMPLELVTRPPPATVNWLADPEKPTLRLFVVLHSEPAPVTSAKLLELPDARPMIAMSLRNSPPAEISNPFCTPRLPTLRFPELSYSAPVPVTAS